MYTQENFPQAVQQFDAIVAALIAHAEGEVENGGNTLAEARISAMEQLVALRRMLPVGEPFQTLRRAIDQVRAELRVSVTDRALARIAQRTAHLQSIGNAVQQVIVHMAHQQKNTITALVLDAAEVASAARDAATALRRAAQVDVEQAALRIEYAIDRAQHLLARLRDAAAQE